MAELFLLSSNSQLHEELLSVVRAIKGYVANQESLSVGLEWGKKRDLSLKSKILPAIKKRFKKNLSGDGKLSSLSSRGRQEETLFLALEIPMRKLFCGEAPGADEDEQGLPFVGRAGQLLTDIIQAMKIERKDVYICNILKCRPPGNRNPLPDEMGYASLF